MTIVTEGQRLEDVKARLEMMANNETLTEDEKQDIQQNTSIRDRLMRRLTFRKVIVTLEDDAGEFTITTRLMKASERERYLKFNAMLSEAQSGQQKYSEAMMGLKELTADLCLTKSLNRDFWLGGDVSDDTILIVLIASFNAAAQAVKDGVERFRR